MERATTYITLDVQKIDSGVLIKARRGDSARQLVVSLTNRGRPYIPGDGVTAVFYERKPDGNPCFNEARIDGCTVTYDFTGQTTNVVGLAACEIRLYDAGGQLLTSPRFELLVDATEYQEGDVPDSSPEYTALTEMVAKGTELIRDLTGVQAGLEPIRDAAIQAAEDAVDAASAAAGSEAAAKGHAEAAASNAVAAADSARAAEASAQDANRAYTETEQMTAHAEDARAEAQKAAQEAKEAAEEAKNASGSGGGAGYVASDEPPENTKALWVDTTPPEEAVALGVTAVETDEGVDLYCTDELGTVKVTVRHGKDSGQNVTQVEPAWGDTPLAFFGKPLQQTKDEIVCEFWYYSKTLKFHCWAEIKAQGNSTLGWPKKNQTVKLYKDDACTEKLKIDFKGWGKQNKFVIKAYWRDLTHARDVGSVRLESECAKSRPGYDTMPEQLRTSPNMGGIDGFPVLVYADGVYQGRYMWNIPKDAWMANMDDELDTHCILCSEDYNSSCFRAAANINGNDWTDEVHDTVPASIKTRWNEVISFVRNSSDEEFVANLDSYIDVESLIDRHLVGLVSCDFDGYGKNQMYMTYDGQKWYAVPYDKDGTWGVFWTGNSMLPSNYGRDQYEDMTQDRPGNLLFIRLEQLFWQQLQERWAYLRNNTLSVANIIARMRELTDIVPPHIVAEDYAPTTAGGAFTGIPNKDTCTIQQIQKFATERHTWTDEYVEGLTPVVPVPCTGISLDKSTLTFTGNGTQTLTASVTPDGCTDAITWESDNTGIATVANGVITAVANGSCTITAKCGEYSASCAVTVNGMAGIVPLNWTSGYTYDKNTGEMTAVNNENCTNKVQLDNCMHSVTLGTGSDYFAIYEWDADGNYNGFVEGPLANFWPNPEHYYAFKVYNENGSASAPATIEPVDNAATAGDRHEIDLATADWKATTTGLIELVVPGITKKPADYCKNFDGAYVIHTLGGIKPAVGNTEPTYGTVLWNGVFYFQCAHFGTDVDAAKAYFAEHGTKLVINA